MALRSPPTVQKSDFCPALTFYSGIFFSNSSLWAKRSLTEDGDWGGEDTLGGLLIPEVGFEGEERQVKVCG